MVHIESSQRCDHHISDYKAEINIADYKETTSEIKLNAVEASVEDVSPVFEKDAVTFSASIKGPSKPSSVVLVHKGEISPCLSIIFPQIHYTLSIIVVNEKQRAKK